LRRISEIFRRTARPGFGGDGFGQNQPLSLVRHPLASGPLFHLTFAFYVFLAEISYSQTAEFFNSISSLPNFAAIVHEINAK
jgi:hypothetical protein